MAKYPQLEVIVTPYSAGSKEKPVGSMFDALRKHDVGLIGIKPFASGTMFPSAGVPDSPTKAEDDAARPHGAPRYVLGCDVLDRSHSRADHRGPGEERRAAVKERRKLDTAERDRHSELSAEMWRNLPPHYHWLREWELV